jgi:hypothetical protein
MMICENDDINTNRFNINVDANDLIILLRALYWYQDKLTNMEQSRGRDNAEWDNVIWIRQQLTNMLKMEAKI